jgi:nucleotide-binding universal stress UspA family protein
MTRSIVVPLDGSELSEQALPLAFRFAESLGATVHIAHVFVPRLDASPRAEELDTEATGYREQEEDARRYLSDVRARYCVAATGRATFDFIRGHPTAGRRGGTAAVVMALRRYASQRRADLIILTSHGRGGINRAWLGSVTDRLVRRARVPVLVVRASVEPGATDLEHVLIPLDGSPLAEQIAPLTLSLAGMVGARVTLLRVIAPRQSLARPAPVARTDIADLARQREEAESYLATALSNAPSEPRTRETTVLSDVNPARAIIAFAESHGVDLIAMTTHGRGGFNRMLTGSVADKVLRGASAHVLIHRPRPV